MAVESVIARYFKHKECMNAEYTKQSAIQHGFNPYTTEEGSEDDTELEENEEEKKEYQKGYGMQTQK